MIQRKTKIYLIIALIILLELFGVLDQLRQLLPDGFKDHITHVIVVIVVMAIPLVFEIESLKHRVDDLEEELRMNKK